MYKLNTHRMLLNKVVDTYLVDENGERVEIEKDKLYRVIADLYSAQMLGTVTDMSFGILSIVPKDAKGNPIDDFEQYIIKDGNEELKMWTAIAHYLNSFETIPEKYQAPEGRKIVSSSLNSAELFKKPNGTTLIVYAVILLLTIVLVCVVKIILKKRRQGKI